MKKILIVALAATAAVLARRKAQANHREQELWAEATDNVSRS